jgi:hypothetical protein
MPLWTKNGWIVRGWHWWTWVTWILGSSWLLYLAG